MTPKPAFEYAVKGAKQKPDEQDFENVKPVVVGEKEREKFA